MSDAVVRKTFCQAYALTFGLQALTLLRAEWTAPEQHSFLTWICILIFASLSAGYAYFLYFEPLKAFAVCAAVRGGACECLVCFAGAVITSVVAPHCPYVCVCICPRSHWIGKTTDEVVVKHFSLSHTLGPKILPVCVCVGGNIGASESKMGEPAPVTQLATKLPPSVNSGRTTWLASPRMGIPAPPRLALLASVFLIVSVWCPAPTGARDAPAVLQRLLEFDFANDTHALAHPRSTIIADTTVAVFNSVITEWRLPPKPTTGEHALIHRVLVLFHGCFHSGSGWFTYPEEVVAVRAALHAGFVVLAFSAKNRCWTHMSPPQDNAEALAIQAAYTEAIAAIRKQV